MCHIFIEKLNMRFISFVQFNSMKHCTELTEKAEML